MSSHKIITRHDLYVFGANDEGQLGNGREQEKEFQASCAIQGAGFRSMRIVGGSKHTLLLNEHGRLLVAGRNNERQLGYFARSEHDKTSLKTSLDLLVSARDNLIRFTHKHSGISFCAAAWESSASIIDVNRTHSLTCPAVYTEGSGSYGELGRGSYTSTADLEPDPVTGSTELGPIQAQLPHSVRDFAAGHAHYAIVLTNGDVWGWGKANKGQLGLASQGTAQLKEIHTPTQLRGISFPAFGITCGKEFTYVVDDGSEGCHAILGADKGGLKSNMPEHVKDWKQIGAMWHSIFVLFKDGTLKAWGKETLFQLIPPNLPPIDRIAVGSEHVLALTQETLNSPQKLIAWGWGEHGNCGDVSMLNPPPPMPRCCISGRWNEIQIPGNILSIGAAQSTSFVLTEIALPILGTKIIGHPPYSLSDLGEATEDHADKQTQISTLQFIGLDTTKSTSIGD